MDLFRGMSFPSSQSLRLMWLDLGHLLGRFKPLSYLLLYALDILVGLDTVFIPWNKAPKSRRLAGVRFYIPLAGIRLLSPMSTQHSKSCCHPWTQHESRLSRRRRLGNYV